MSISILDSPQQSPAAKPAGSGTQKLRKGSEQPDDDVVIEPRGATSTGRAKRTKNAQVEVVIDEDDHLISDGEKGSEDQVVPKGTTTSGRLRKMFIKCVSGLEEGRLNENGQPMFEEICDYVVINVKFHPQGFAYITDDKGQTYFKSKNIYEKLHSLLTLQDQQKISESEIESFVYVLRNWKFQEFTDYSAESRERPYFYDVMFDTIKLIDRDDQYHTLKFEKDLANEDQEVKYWILSRIDRWLALPASTRSELQIAKKSPMSSGKVATTEEEDAVLISKEAANTTEQSDSIGAKIGSDAQSLAKLVIAGKKRLKGTSNNSADQGQGSQNSAGEANQSKHTEINLVTPNRNESNSNINIYMGSGTDEDIGEIDISMKKRASPEVDGQAIRESVKATRGSISRDGNYQDSGLPSNQDFKSNSQMEESVSGVPADSNIIGASEMEESSQAPRSLMTAEELQQEQLRYKKKPVEEMTKEILEEFQQRVANDDAFSTESLELYKHLLADHQDMPHNISGLIEDERAKISRRTAEKRSPTAMKSATARTIFPSSRPDPIANTTQALAEISAIRDELQSERDLSDPSSLLSQIRTFEMEQTWLAGTLLAHTSDPHSTLSPDQCQHLLACLTSHLPSAISSLSSDLVTLRKQQDTLARRTSTSLSSLPSVFTDLLTRTTHTLDKEHQQRDAVLGDGVRDLSDRLGAVARDVDGVKARVDRVVGDVGEIGGGRDGLAREVRELYRGLRRLEERGGRDDRIEGLLAQLLAKGVSAQVHPHVPLYGAVGSAGAGTPGKSDKIGGFRSGKSPDIREMSAERRSKSASKKKASTGGRSKSKLEDEPENEDPLKVKYAMKLIGRRKRHLTNMDKLRGEPSDDSESFAQVQTVYRARSKSKRSLSSTSRENKRSSRSKSRPKYQNTPYYSHKDYKKRVIHEETDDTPEESVEMPVTAIGRKRSYR